MEIYKQTKKKKQFMQFDAIRYCFVSNVQNGKLV